MSTQTFTWRVLASANGSGEFKSKVAKFGEGYAQEWAESPNNEVAVWNVTVVHDDVDAALAFIRARMGVEAFYWTPPKGTTPLLWKCKKYTGPIDQGAGVFTLDMTFEQAFAP